MKDFDEEHIVEKTRTSITNNLVIQIAEDYFLTQDDAFRLLQKTDIYKRLYSAEDKLYNLPWQELYEMLELDEYF